MKTRAFKKIAKIVFLVWATVLPARQATATTVFHLSLPTTNNQIYEANIPFAGSISSDQFVGVFFSIPPYINTDPDLWEAAFSAGLRVGFESHEARAMRRTRSMTDAA